MLYNRLSSSIGRALLLIFFLNMSVGCNRIGHFTDPLAMEKNIDQAPKTSFATVTQPPIENEVVEVEPNLTWRDRLYNFCRNLLLTENTVRYLSGSVLLADTMLSLYSIEKEIKIVRSSQSPDLFRCANLELLAILVESLGLMTVCKLGYRWCLSEGPTAFMLQCMNAVHYLIEFIPIARMWNPVSDRLAHQDTTMGTFYFQMLDFVVKDKLAWSIMISATILRNMEVMLLRRLRPRPQHQD